MIKIKLGGTTVKRPKGMPKMATPKIPGIVKPTIRIKKPGVI
jgi:hypothetical protein